MKKSDNFADKHRTNNQPRRMITKEIDININTPRKWKLKYGSDIKRLKTIQLNLEE